MQNLLEYINPNGYSLAFLLIGITLRYIIGRRKFNRRGIGGLQHFDSFGLALIVTFLEWLLKWTANILVIASIFMLIKW